MKTNIVNKRHVEYVSKWVITPKNGSAGDEGSMLLYCAGTLRNIPIWYVIENS